MKKAAVKSAATRAYMKLLKLGCRFFTFLALHLLLYRFSEQHLKKMENCSFEGDRGTTVAKLRQLAAGGGEETKSPTKRTEYVLE